MVYLGDYNLARLHSKDPKRDLEKRIMLMKRTVIWSDSTAVGCLVLQK